MYLDVPFVLGCGWLNKGRARATQYAIGKKMWIYPEN